MDIKNLPKPKEQKKIGREPKYKPEYYMMMAKHIVDEGLTHREAAKIYRCSHGTVCHWLKLYRSGQLPVRVEKAKNKAKNYEAQLARFERHVRELKTEIGELYLENQMLKKALEVLPRSRKDDLSVITSENLDQWQKDVE